MNVERVFSLCGTVVLPCWLLLAFAPRWRWTGRIVTFLVPVTLAAIYAWELGTATPAEGSGFRSLAQVRLLFSVDQTLLAGWIHYLAFDLFTGAWEARDAARLGIARWLVAPCLLMTFLVGPVGLAAYLLLRAFLHNRFGAAEETPA